MLRNAIFAVAVVVGNVACFIPTQGSKQLSLSQQSSPTAHALYSNDHSLLSKATSFVSKFSLYSKSYCEGESTVTVAKGFEMESDDPMFSVIQGRLNGFERIDQKLEEPEFHKYVKDHALHETLKGSGMIETYHIYRSLTQNEILCVIKIGDKLNGHPKIVHGGITSMLFDNSFGWLFWALNIPPAMTANLVVNYK